MNNFKSLFILLILMITSQAKASYYEIGVTGVEVCGRKVKLYDFVEGANPLIHNIKLWKRKRGVDEMEYLTRAVDHIKRDLPELSERLDRYVDIAKSRFYAYNLGRDFARVKEKDIPLVSNGCRYQDLAAWQFDFIMIVVSDMDMVKKLPKMDLAGLLLGRALYHMAADSKQYWSDRSIRKLVAKVFSDEKLTEQDSRMLFNQTRVDLHNAPICTDYVFKKILENQKDINRSYNSCMSMKLIDHDHIPSYEKLYSAIGVHEWLIDQCKKYCTIYEDTEKVCEDFRIKKDYLSECQSR